MKLITAFVLLTSFCGILPADSASWQDGIHIIYESKKIKQFNYQNNNRIDRQSYARVNRQIYQPKKEKNEQRRNK